MQNVLIINAYHPHPGTDGKLTSSLEKIARQHFSLRGMTIGATYPADPWDIDAEIIKHQQSDLILLLAPVYWMGVSWSFQKYMDEVYSAGMDGRLSRGDGRSRHDANSAYGMGGRLHGKYMITTSFNAPRDAFDNPAAPFFQGKSVDDLFLPMHKNFQFFGLKPLPTFSMFDVFKNPDVKTGLDRFSDHLEQHV